MDYLIDLDVCIKGFYGERDKRTWFDYVFDLSSFDFIK